MDIPWDILIPPHIPIQCSELNIPIINKIRKLTFEFKYSETLKDPEYVPKKITIAHKIIIPITLGISLSLVFFAIEYSVFSRLLQILISSYLSLIYSIVAFPLT